MAFVRVHPSLQPIADSDPDPCPFLRDAISQTSGIYDEVSIVPDSSPTTHSDNIGALSDADHERSGQMTTHCESGERPLIQTDIHRIQDTSYDKKFMEKKQILPRDRWYYKVGFLRVTRLLSSLIYLSSWYIYLPDHLNNIPTLLGVCTVIRSPYNRKCGNSC